MISYDVYMSKSLEEVSNHIPLCSLFSLCREVACFGGKVVILGLGLLIVLGIQKRTDGKNSLECSRQSQHVLFMHACMHACIHRRACQDQFLGKYPSTQ